MEHREDLNQNVACMRTPGDGQRRLLSVVTRDRLVRILERLLDENEFLSPHGIRSVSKFHADNPYRFDVADATYQVDYEPAESTSGMFGGNSNWRGPIWFPLNYLLIEALQKFHHYYGDALQVEFPTGSGNFMNLWEVANNLSRRLTSIFLTDSIGSRPVFTGIEMFRTNPQWKDLILFYEYFHGETGAGLGASHQTGWTGLVAKLIEQCDEYQA